MRRWIDLRSDTVTQPTEEMRRAMAQAEVGDDVYGEDPTVNLLQERAAAVFGKEAALFVPTGTMGNQIAIHLHTRPGQEVIAEERSHVVMYEMAGMAALSGCIPKAFHAENGKASWPLVEPLISPDIYYRARTGLIVLENTHNMAGGSLLDADETSRIAGESHARRIPVHLDGARIFNAAAALETTPEKLCRECDSVMFCLSKGLCAPAGSLLLGSKSFIQEAWRVRKLFGGGMRQIGILAAAGLIALEKMPARLREDHEKAWLLAQGLQELNLADLDLERFKTNIVIADLREKNNAEVLSELRKRRILAGATGPQQIRFVTHRDITAEDVQATLQTLREILGPRC
ncbi:MAG: aminotransferase class I/II-fold pyridoxal phosphate-dependent enzyme [Acidobacteria bacterium]|nr:aminotransferase class I/II-fold pyridoxal phosphate-dependent enzyme [Acidobacteriota bacterium]